MLAPLRSPLFAHRPGGHFASEPNMALAEIAAQQSRQPSMTDHLPPLPFEARWIEVCFYTPLPPRSLLRKQIWD